jgi:hypothetical protein
MKGSFLRTLRFLFSALAIGQALFLVMAYVIRTSGRLEGLNDPIMATALSIAVSIVTISGLTMSQFLFKFKVSAALQKENLEEKLAEYRIACILRWALIEFPSLLAACAFLFTGNRIFPGVFALCFLVYMNARPIQERIKADLQLSEEEAESIITE